MFENLECACPVQTCGFIECGRNFLKSGNENYCIISGPAPDYDHSNSKLHTKIDRHPLNRIKSKLTNHKIQNTVFVTENICKYNGNRYCGCNIRQIINRLEQRFSFQKIAVQYKCNDNCKDYHRYRRKTPDNQRVFN